MVIFDSGIFLICVSTENSSSSSGAVLIFEISIDIVVLRIGESKVIRWGMSASPLVSGWKFHNREVASGIDGVRASSTAMSSSPLAESIIVVKGLLAFLGSSKRYWCPPKVLFVFTTLDSGGIGCIARSARMSSG